MCACSVLFHWNKGPFFLLCLVCVCVCVCVHVCARMSVYALRMVSMDMILRFVNTLIINNYDHYLMRVSLTTKCHQTLCPLATRPLLSDTLPGSLGVPPEKTSPMRWRWLLCHGLGTEQESNLAFNPFLPKESAWQILLVEFTELSQKEVSWVRNAHFGDGHTTSECTKSVN